MSTKGLLVVYTGDGKGKTTAALGLAFRALGHELPVCVIQFMKGTWKYGELRSANQFASLLEFHVVGAGFTWKIEDIEIHRKAAQKGWRRACGALASRRHTLVILDELTYPIKYGLIDETEVFAVLRARPPAMHVVVTGRDASPALLDMADLVTEMREIKHPFKAGVEAQKGIEF